MYLDILSSGSYLLMGVYGYAHLWEAVYLGIAPLGAYPLMGFIGICPLAVGSVPGYNTLRFYLLMGCLGKSPYWQGWYTGISTLDGLLGMSTYPCLFSWVYCRYNTPRYYVYLGRPTYITSILGYTSVYKIPKYSASSMVYSIDLSAQHLVLGILLSVTPLEILALL